MGLYHDVIIIGAGISGLAAAQRLRNLGYDTVIVEARERVGGRIHTNNEWGIPLDVGASWVCGLRGNPIESLAKKFNVHLKRTNEEKSIKVYDSNGNLVNTTALSEIGKIWKKLMTFVVEQENKISETANLENLVLKFMHDNRLDEVEKKNFNYAISMLENDWAASIDRLSAKFWDHIGYVLPGGQDVVRDGYGAIVQGLVDEIGMESIRLNNIVTKIEYDKDDRVKVTVREGTKVEELEAKYVICTLPLGVLEREQKQLFSPPLPTTKVASIYKIRMGRFHKTYLLFDKPFWDEEVDWINYISDKKGFWNTFLNIEKLTRPSGKERGKPILLALNAADYAVELEKKSLDEIKEEAFSVLRKIYKEKACEPEKIIVTNWALDPFARGAYSYTPAKAELEDYDHLAAPVRAPNGINRVFFAGEATTKYYPATVHGAYMTGLREANRVHISDKKLEFSNPEDQQRDEEKGWSVFPEQVIPPEGMSLIAHIERMDNMKIYRPVFARKVGEGRYSINGKTVDIDEKEWFDHIISTPYDYFPTSPS